LKCEYFSSARTTARNSIGRGFRPGLAMVYNILVL
jgi:hypothetical protein